jgi:hypothetical protein
VTLTENISLVENKILSQFIEDSQEFNANLKPIKVYKYENTIDINPTGQNNYIIKVWYVSVNNDKLLYIY